MTGLLRLPPGITQDIAGRIDPRSRIVLAGTNRQLRSQLRDERQAVRIIVRDAPRVRTNQGFDAVLQRIGELPVYLRGEALEALGDRIWSLPQAAQATQFDRVFGAIGQLPDQHRSDPLAALGRQIHALRQAAWFKKRDFCVTQTSGSSLRKKAGIVRIAVQMEAGDDLPISGSRRGSKLRYTLGGTLSRERQAAWPVSDNYFGRSTG
ncbi:hypothetical protein [Paraburkholderia sp. JPY465]|uniref:hypothetical protein n=1 Tax=Paraburkholderia sp. JPY465 TaxID=3042285 RepID=UPI003D255313